MYDLMAVRRPTGKSWLSLSPPRPGGSLSIASPVEDVERLRSPHVADTLVKRVSRRRHPRPFYMVRKPGCSMSRFWWDNGKQNHMSQGKRQDTAPGSGSVDRRSFLAAAAIPCALGATTPAAQAQEAAGFIPLFDGHTLAGWVIEEGQDSSFYVKDGAIVAHESAMPPTWLRSQGQYENFEATGEFFVKGWMDSGFCFHAPEHGEQQQPGGQQCSSLILWINGTVWTVRASEKDWHSAGVFDDVEQPLLELVPNLKALTPQPPGCWSFRPCSAGSRSPGRSSAGP